MKNVKGFEPIDMEEITAEHHSDTVFPDLEDDIEPIRHEWEAGPGFLSMACGCVCEVFFGDIVWMIAGDEPDTLIAIAIDPPTIH